ncbi:hypothetical protein CSKR_100456 [Clonorchis sinensis]|uniref:Uncharacterized protein n=1 Tax=Clonorchis sinensis TaxID=79923 RepID=A0A3R7CHG1_CLOSI|nr:hypothetical protein CSKR_100456 [Clonorchis sinensis]
MSPNWKGETGHGLSKNFQQPLKLTAHLYAYNSAYTGDSRGSQPNLSSMGFFLNCMCCAKSASCFSCYDIRDIAMHCIDITHKAAENPSTAHNRFCLSLG